MSAANKAESLLLFVGDITLFFISLWVTLVIRYFEIPGSELWQIHIVPFSFLFVLWILIFFIAGLYGKHTVIFKTKLPNIILKVQIINIVLAAVFFFFIPAFGIAPKTNLVIYLAVSSTLITFWRLIIFPILHIKKPTEALLVGSGEVLHELEGEVNNNNRYNLRFVSIIDLDTISNNEELIALVQNATANLNVSIVVVDAQDDRVMPVLPALYTLLFQEVRFIELSRLYEDIFDCIPVSFIRQNWLLGNVTLKSKSFYDLFKRLFDIVISLILGTMSLVVYPFVALAIKSEDGGSVFFVQDRIGKNGKPIRLTKFRSMSELEKEKVTPIGNILRKSRIDELPQLFAVLRGDLSLIGPRPEIPKLVTQYEQRVPYYNIRHLIKPGLSGWAQIHQNNPPKFGVQYDETALKLSYDLYYVKNRSFFIDFKIALFTLKTLLSRTGL